MFFRINNKQNDKKQQLIAETDSMIERYRSEMVATVLEFNQLRDYRSRKYIRTVILVTEIEHGRLVIKLLKLWISGIFGILFRLFKKDVDIEKLNEKELQKIVTDTRQNYAKRTLSKINMEVQEAFAKAGYHFNTIRMDDFGEQTERHKRYPRSIQTKFWWLVSKVFSASKLPSLLIIFFSGFSVFLGQLVLFITKIFNNEWYMNFSIAVHFTSGVANAAHVFNDWIDDIAEQIEQYTASNEINAEELADQWIEYIKSQTKRQIHSATHRIWRKAAIAGVVLLLGCFSIFKFAPATGDVFSRVFGSEQGINSHVQDTSQTVSVPALINKEEVINHLNNKSEITIRTVSGKDFVFERIIPKMIFGGTIPTSDLKVKVIYDYSASYVLNLKDLTEGNIHIEQDIYRIYIPMPMISQIRISNERKELSGALFASRDTPEAEIEEFEPGNDSYIEILRKEAKMTLLADHVLRSEIETEAQKQVKELVMSLDQNLKEVHVLILGSVNT